MAGTLVRFPTRKTEELFAYLLCHPGKDISKWRLGELLWPDMAEERVTHNLHNTVYRLKKILKEHVIGMDVLKAGEGYRLESGSMTYDALLFERSPVDYGAGLREISEAGRLCSLYQGPLLDGKPYLWKAPLE
ncbi:MULTISPECIES: hypothetical protein [unclassified Paenibacillus]|uniref:AfsR/SARP family transcriptional regulator n=1 Tax=unclassified Paenibacillus TaxID=185978 RepID=UPI0024052CF2|nr:MULTISPECIES: hypothetical protein [unclassified Paenibacillus]MDF9839465.1 two-component SAPR family response regulator [Paenibacillus sp. PastF-2]MDF9846046.1 two-component SAPR family response regulator [Paenibacillus sp. PastM-2]MDF9852619.1 two-component SAPR family response regulator [Paenibacillus sp. PastF-1]MDH6477650.1 two-component SAPR family response regulator [Paenibacillus sp. PastH-2]MDH6505392.1 two-component SAPR family response regulator [Paenibacillus sp. PastM-3]